MEYKEEEEHLRHADTPTGVDQIKADMASHFQSSGKQTEGDLDVVKHSADPGAAPRVVQGSQLEAELEGMVRRHPADESGEGGFVRGVAGVFTAYAEEEDDAE